MLLTLVGDAEYVPPNPLNQLVHLSPSYFESCAQHTTTPICPLLQKISRRQIAPTSLWVLYLPLLPCFKERCWPVTDLCKGSKHIFCNVALTFWCNFCTTDFAWGQTNKSQAEMTLLLKIYLLTCIASLLPLLWELFSSKPFEKKYSS